MKTKAIALLAVIGLCVQAAHAAEPYTLEQLKALAMEANPSLGAARADVEVSRADTLTARAYPNPELEVMGGDRNSRGPNLAPGSLGTIGLSQRFDYPSQRDARLRVAEAGVVSAQSGVQSFEIDLLAQLKQNYYLVIRFQDELRAAREDLELARSIRNRVEVRVNTGEAPRYELIRADTELLTAQKNADAAVLRIVQAKTRLRALVAGQLPEDFDLQGELERDAELPPLGQLRDDMLARNPEIFRLKAEINRFTEQRELEKLRRMPDVSLKLARDRDPEYDANRIGVAVTIPIFDRRQGQIAQAGAQVERTRLQLDNRLFQLQQQLDAAYRQFELSRNQVSALETGIVREAEAALKVAEAAYRFGERGILDFLDAQRVFRAVRNELISARYDLSAAVVEIERLSAVR
ncbi:TolC family protein [Methyloversatilis sp.]|uniref:TolC family protein n=1 Tax=Methyloversatilis sp. TaxID=2569862 RepID=UPI0027323029|nr:TolC family protein [Methyloversatilis sp.]MDP2869588.1 TolC family protein [Methyloversatilis sp.]MDP3289195.1 TolC family protein [Methyloversatilis sp.]MDP3456149.1 TolC family protein [Methyloversatilis sp.]MDP3577402.1 TolC family protein [Methyloversatilis sp.]